MEAMGRVYIGTSGCSYKSWDKAFYPANVRKSRQFEFYATQFNPVPHCRDQQHLLPPADNKNGGGLAR